MHQGDQLLIPYQWCLHAMGAELDVLQASMITIIEEPEAFTLHFQSAHEQQEWCVLWFSYEELLARRTELERLRPKRTILSSGAKCQPRGYQHLLHRRHWSTRARTTLPPVVVHSQNIGVMVVHDRHGNFALWLTRPRRYVLTRRGNRESSSRDRGSPRRPRRGRRRRC